MKILLLHPDRRISSIDQIRCFSDVWGYYLGNELSKHVSVTHTVVPRVKSNDELSSWFSSLDVSEYDAVIGLGLRYFSDIPKEIVDNLRQRLYPGFLCQVYDGSRLDTDGVDITFTIKNDDFNEKYQFGSSANRFVRHHAYNEYIGWAADPILNYPDQSNHVLRLLVDHTNYGSNPIDNTTEIINQIRSFYDSNVWRDRWHDIVVRRFDSGRVVTVDLQDRTSIERYDRTGIPYRDICQEHGQAHVFFVTHPESVGLVVLETAMAGALTVTPQNFIPQDRLNTVRHYTYQDQINWTTVLQMIDPLASRKQAIGNSWENVAKRLRDTIVIRKKIRGASR